MTSVPPEVLEQAVALVNSLAANKAFRDQIAEDEIARRVDAGELIPVERLAIAPGLVLVPRGRIPELEAAARRVVNAWLNIPGEQGWTEEEVILSRSVKGLAALFDVAEFGDDEPDDEPDADLSGADDTIDDADDDGRRGQASDAAAASATPNFPAEPDEDPPSDGTTSFAPSSEVEKPVDPQVDAPAAEGVGPPGMPVDMPAADDRGPCARCGNDIDEPNQAQLSWILTREVLCRSCHTGSGPDNKEDGDAAPADP